MSDASVKEKGLAEYHMFDQEMMECPYHYYKLLRDEAPVQQDPLTGIFQISRYDLVAEVARNAELFSSEVAGTRAGGLEEGEEEATPNDGYPGVNTMLTADNPKHDIYRSVINKAFSPKRVNGLERDVTEIVDGLINMFIDNGQVEFMKEFAQQLPMLVIIKLLGLPVADKDKFRLWSDAFVVNLSQTASEEEFAKAQADILDYQNYFAALYEEKRETPTDDIISEMSQARIIMNGEERPLEMPEALSILQQLLVAGNETTASTLTEGMYYLISNPDQLQEVTANMDLIPSVVEETLRMLSPSSNMWRRAAQDTELAGVKIPRDSMIMIRYGSANRDERQFAESDPGDFNIHRDKLRTHLAFGFGIHTCVGNTLARKELQTAYRQLLTRIKNWRFADGKNDFKHEPNILLRHMNELHLEFEKV
jgi:cytochrome P450